MRSAQATSFSAWLTETAGRAAAPYLCKPRGVHLFSIPGLSFGLVVFVLFCFFPCAATQLNSKRRTLSLNSPGEQALNCVTLFNQSQRLTRARTRRGFTSRINRAELCSSGAWLAWSSPRDARGSCGSAEPRGAGSSRSHRCRAAGQPPLSFLGKTSAARHNLRNNNRLIMQI